MGYSSSLDVFGVHACCHFGVMSRFEETCWAQGVNLRRLLT